MPLTIPPLDGQRGPSWTTSSMLGARNRFLGNGSNPVSTAWPAVNTAILVPFVVGFPTTFPEIFFQAGTTPGTTAYDLGVYRDDFTLIKSIGATSAVSITDTVLPSGGGAFTTPLTLMPGRYYIAMSSAATTLTVRAQSPGNSIPRALGCLSMATAHPLPSTITPAQASTLIPQIGLTTITNIL